VVLLGGAGPGARPGVTLSEGHADVAVTPVARRLLERTLRRKQPDPAAERNHS
jgi:hypothetical protein